MQPRLNTKSKSDDQAEVFGVEEPARKSSVVSTLRSPSQPDVRMVSLSATEEERQKPASPSSIANQRCAGLLFVSSYIRFRSSGLSCHAACET
jgi:hypothetical protein